MKVKVKFFQITSCGGLLHGLDGEGQVWERDAHGAWSRITHPMIEGNTTPIPDPKKTRPKDDYLFSES